MTPAQIKYAYQDKRPDGHFFDRGTMKWFGDTMASYGTRTIDGQIYMYRKRDKMVNVFGNWKRCGRGFFNAWRFDPVTADLDSCDAAETNKVWEVIYG